MEVYHHGVALTMQQGYACLLPRGMSVAVLAVYLHLRRIGYITRWHVRIPPVQPQSAGAEAEVATSEGAAEAPGSTPQTPGSAATPAPGTAPGTPSTPAAGVLPSTPLASPGSPGAALLEVGGWFSTLGTRLLASVRRTVSPFVHLLTTRGDGAGRGLPALEPFLRRQDSTTFDDVYARLRQGVGRQTLMNLDMPSTPPRLTIDLDVRLAGP